MLNRLRRLRARLRRSQLDDELQEEIRHHLDLRRQQLIESGVAPLEADRQARRMFGNVTAIREETRAMCGASSIDTLTQDVRYGLRVIGKSPGFSAVAILSLAVGIGASAVLFSFANAFLFRPLRAANPAELVQLFTSNSDGSPYGGSSYPDYEEFRESTTVFTGLLASMRARATLSDADRPDLMDGLIVSGNYFNVLGLRPSLGRFFLPEENRTPGADAVVVLSHDAWQRRFGSDPQIVGRVIGLSGHLFTVIGVGPPRFAGTGFDHSADLFVPVMMQAILSPGSDVVGNRRARVFSVFGRLRAGVTPREADAALRLLAAQLLLRDADAWRDKAGRGRIITVLPEIEARFATSGPEPVVFMYSSVIAGTLLLLGIACVNVATVLLARASTRRKEIAVRLAIGASRRRVVRQLLTECALLAAAGCLLGLLLAQSVAILFARFRPHELPAFDLSLDYRIVAFGIAASVLTVVLFGLAPALQTTRPDVSSELKGTARTVKLRRFRIGLRDGLVIVQVALSMTLIIGAALLFRSVRAGGTVDPGFRRAGVLSAEINLATVAGGRRAHARFYREAVRSVAALPGIERVALAALVPMDGSNLTTKIVIADGGPVRSTWPDTNVVGPGYFALMDIPVKQGREFTASDREGLPLVAVVNEAMAARFWNGNAVGQVFKDEPADAQVQIVGVVRDLRHRSFGETPRPMVYYCADQLYQARMTLHLQTAAPPAAVAVEMLRTLHEIDPAAALGRAQTMPEYITQVTMPQRLGGLAAAGIGLLELALAIMALYGVIAYATAQRTREIGLRMALGAPARSVTRLIMRDGLILAGAGVILGVALALVAGPVLASLLIGVGAADPVSFGVAAAVLLVVAAVASYVPARRALRVDPSIALRTE